MNILACALLFTLEDFSKIDTKRLNFCIKGYVYLKTWWTIKLTSKRTISAYNQTNNISKRIRFPTPLSARDINQSDGHISVVICITLITLFICSLIIYFSFSVNFLFISIAHFSNQLSFFFLICRSFPPIMNVNYLLLLCKYFLPGATCLKNALIIQRF